MLAELDRQIGALDAEIDRRARESEVVRRLMTIPGIGPLIATALATLARPRNYDDPRISEIEGQIIAGVQTPWGLGGQRDVA